MNKIKGSERLYLKIPSYDELAYRQKLLADPDTMNYNAGIDMSYVGYDKKTGCIDFNESKWQNWYDKWIGNTPKRFFAYICRKEDDVFIGDVACHYDEETKENITEILIEAKYRRMGYSEEALRLLMKTAFEGLGLESLVDNIPNDRISAHKVFEKVGFKKKRAVDGVTWFELQKEDVR
ncbi:MAG: hypothetical protein A2Y18_04290 [Clostridiales bacterium GWD2_32_19]|nr:MAG: hypothetical protein A2Y18_04290 [Clostridiales bacterium GWD2_32_19]